MLDSNAENSAEGGISPLTADLLNRADSRERLETILAAQLDGVVVIDETGTIESLNSVVTDLFGYSEAELRGQNVSRLLPPEEAAQHDRYLERYRSTGEARIVGSGREVAGRRQDGTTFPIYLTVSEMFLDGERRFTGVIRDLSEVRRVQKALRKSESTLQAVFDTAVDTIIIIDERGNIRSTNRAFQLVFGYDSEEVVGRNVSMLMPSPYREEHDGYLHRYLAGGDPRIIGIGREVQAVRKDGTVFPAELAVSEVQLSEDQRYFTGIVRDVTPRKRAEETLRELVLGSASTRDLSLFESLCEHLCRALHTSYAFVGELDRDQRSISTLAFWAKDSLGENFRYELVGTPCETVIGQTPRAYHGDTWKQFPGDEALARLQIRCYVGAPLVSARGDPLGVLAVMDEADHPALVDASQILQIFAARASSELERLQAERQLRDRVRQQQIVAQLGSDALSGVPIADLMDRAVRMTVEILAAEIGEVLEVALDCEEVVVRAAEGWEKNHQGERVPSFPGTHAGFTLGSEGPVIVLDLETETRFDSPRLRDAGVASSLSVRIRGRDSIFGLLALHSRSGRRFTEDDAYFLESIGNVLGEAIVNRLHQEERARQESLTKLGEMSAMVAHEVKNPLAGIISGARMLLRRTPEDREFEREVLDEIITTTENLSRGVRDILSFSRPRTPKRRALPARALVESAISLAEKDPTFEAIEIELSGEDPQVLCDGEMIGPVFLNLLQNAAQAIVGPGRIAVRLTEVDSRCMFEFQDSGPGIPPDRLSQVFEPFFTTKGGGTGLGLSIAKRTVELHDGSISIDSSPNNGTRVSIALPLADNSKLGEP